MSILTKQMIEKEMEYCISCVDKGLEKYRYCYFPTDNVNNTYTALHNSGWTGGFWSGMVWLAYQMTGDPKYREVAECHVNGFHERLLNNFDIDHHDLGFEYTLSCISAYKITGSELAKKSAVMAADALLKRYEPVGKFLKPWGKMDDPVENRIIVDTYLNLPLLFWASEVTGDNKYRDTALNHLDTTVDILVRPDGRAYHTYMMDLNYGNPIMPKVDQGYADDSVWSRGQAWVIYGLALAYSYTHMQKLADVQTAATNTFINLLPSDYVPAWDMIFTDTRTLKDTSAAVIAACGMLEMNKLVPDHADAQKWNDVTENMVKALMTDHSTKGMNLDSTAILLHGTSSVRHNMGINQSLIYGDYYYMETLMRMLNPDWKRFW